MGIPVGRFLALVGLLTGAGAAGLIALGQGADAQTFPCQAPNHGFVFDTYEALNYTTEYAEAITLAAEGKAAPAPYAIADGETIDVSFPGVASGPRSDRQPPNVALGIPPSVFESIVWAESGWSNGATSVPYGGVGPTLLSNDCGYGLAQVTSGMGQFGSDALAPGVPSATQALVGTDFLFNLAEGARILAQKWNSAPSVRPIAGSGDPTKLEDWYYAIWSYNGFALKNHPLNPDLNPLRGGGTSVEPVYHCNDPAAPNYDPLPTGQPTFNRGDFTYDEVVYGCMRYPPYLPGVTPPAPSPTPSPTPTPTPSPSPTGFQPGQTVVVTGTGDGLNIRQSPSTSAPTAATVPDGTSLTIGTGGSQSADGYTWWPVKVVSSGAQGWAAGQYLAAPGSSSTGPPAPNPPPLTPSAGRLFLPQLFSMPDFSQPAVAAAFQLSNFSACMNAGFVGGCPSMDFPTSIPTAKPPIVTHTDSTPLVPASDYATLIGKPMLSVSGPSAASLGVSSTGASNSVELTVSNTGTAVAPFRIRTSAPWIVVNHPGNTSGISMNGGVAVAGGVQVVLASAHGSRPAATQAGYQSDLQVTLDPSTMPAGDSSGWVLIEPLLGGGSPFKLTIKATNAQVADAPLTHRAVVPGLASDGSS